MKLPQLTLRDLFWLVALVAMGCGWWVERRDLQQEVLNLKQSDPEEWRLRAEKLAEYVRSGGGTVSWGKGELSIEGCAGTSIEVWPIPILEMDVDNP
jgi:hypothetical protein